MTNKLPDDLSGFDGTTKGPLTVGFDGPSRPIIMTPNRMLTIGAIEHPGRSSSYDEEEADCKLFAAAPLLLTEVKKLRKWKEAVSSAFTTFQYTADTHRTAARQKFIAAIKEADKEFENG